MPYYPAPFNPATTLLFFEDFLFGNALTTNNSGTGSAAAQNTGNVTDQGGHPGQVTLETGTTTTGRAGLQASSGVTQMLFGNGAVTYETDVYLTDAVSDGTDTYTLYIGFNDSGSGLGTDGIMFRYTHGTNSGKWECVTRQNGSETAADSGVTVASTTWYKLGIVVNAAANSVSFYINGALVATNTTNIPTGASRQTTPAILIIKSAGTNNRRMACDYVYCRIDLTTSR